MSVVLTVPPVPLVCPLGHSIRRLGVAFQFCADLRKDSLDKIILASLQIGTHLKGELKIPTNFVKGSSLKLRSPLGYCRVYLSLNVVFHEPAPVCIFPVRQQNPSILPTRQIEPQRLLFTRNFGSWVKTCC
jgi:hypothetical protein